MIDIDQILEWKAQYGDIFQTQILDTHYIFRAIGREEYKQIILMNLPLGEYQEALCFNTVIYPESYNYSEGIAGIAEVLTDFILDISGLHENQSLELITDYREEMNHYDYQVDCMIHEAFPEYSIEEISNWPVRKTMYYLSRAEWILTYLKGAPIDFTSAIPAQEPVEEPIPQKQQPRQAPQPPPQREIRKELIEGPSEEKKEPAPASAPLPEGGIQSEEELLAMLEGAGGKVSAPSKDMEDVKPELNWFSYMDELKGDFE